MSPPTLPQPVTVRPPEPAPGGRTDFKGKSRPPFARDLSAWSILLSSTHLVFPVRGTHSQYCEANGCLLADEFNPQKIEFSRTRLRALRCDLSCRGCPGPCPSPIQSESSSRKAVVQPRLLFGVPLWSVHFRKLVIAPFAPLLACRRRSLSLACSHFRGRYYQNPVLAIDLGRDHVSGVAAP